MKIVSVFNNKGGVGKTTLAFHLASILAEMGHPTLMIDLDPQCNLTLYSLDEDQLESIWEEENSFIDELGFEEAKIKTPKAEYNKLVERPRSIHFLLKPTEEGTGELENLPPPLQIRNNLCLIPGRLTLHLFESKISERWNGAYRGDPLSIRTITRIRKIAAEYGETYGFEYVLVDTSPNLGSLNKTIISTVDGFLVPNNPDMFSIYGIRNIGKSLGAWKKEFETIYGLISDSKRKNFPDKFVQFLGYTIYNAKKRSGKNEWDLASSHYNYAARIPETIEKYIPEGVRSHLGENFAEPIGDKAVMHTHNTFPGSAQKYKLPIWKVPNHSRLDPEENEKSSILGNQAKYIALRDNYRAFAEDFLSRVSTI